MAAKGQAKSGGRSKGTPNKRTIHLERLRGMGFDPFEMARKMAAGEVEDTQIVGSDKDGKLKAVKVPLSWALRQKSIHELMSYMEPKLKAIEHSGPGGGPLQTTTRIESVIVDPKHTED